MKRTMELEGERWDQLEERGTLFTRKDKQKYKSYIYERNRKERATLMRQSDSEFQKQNVKENVEIRG